MHSTTITETPEILTGNRTDDKFRPIATIENGTVIDHISSGKAIFLLRLLKLENHPKSIMIGLNLPSSRMKTKDLIKVEGWDISEKEASQIAIFSSQTTINIIQNHRVAHKYVVSLPETIEGFMICPNPQCITNHETTPTYFTIIPNRSEILLQCKFCEKIFHHNAMTGVF